MPTLNLEYSSNLQFDTQPVLKAINQTLMQSNEFNELDIKSRAVRMDDFVIGTESGQRGFVIINMKLLSGRSIETRDAISAALVELIQKAIPTPAGMTVQYCVDLVEVDRPRYRKAIIGN